MVHIRESSEQQQYCQIEAVDRICFSVFYGVQDAQQTWLRPTCPHQTVLQLLVNVQEKENFIDVVYVQEEAVSKHEVFSLCRCESGCRIRLDTERGTLPVSVRHVMD